MERVICLFIGYVFGLFQTAYFYGKTKGIDIRKYGSGNAGTTNALRVLGTKAGLIVFAGDCLKCIIAVCITRALFSTGHPENIYLLCLYTCLLYTSGEYLSAVPVYRRRIHHRTQLSVLYGI